MAYKNQFKGNAGQIILSTHFKSEFQSIQAEFDSTDYSRLLRVPEGESLNAITSFDINSLWQFSSETVPQPVQVDFNLPASYKTVTSEWFTYFYGSIPTKGLGAGQNILQFDKVLSSGLNYDLVNKTILFPITGGLTFINLNCYVNPQGANNNSVLIEINTNDAGWSTLGSGDVEARTNVVAGDVTSPHFINIIRVIPGNSLIRVVLDNDVTSTISEMTFTMVNLVNGLV